MFYAQNLKKKLDSDYKPYLKINKDCLFPYKFTKNNSTTLLAELKVNAPEFTHMQLKEMTNDDYLNNFTKKRLIKKWLRKCKVSYPLTSNKFTQKLSNRTLEAKNYIKNYVDKDIFELKKPKWNNSTLKDDKESLKIKEYLKQIKYQADHDYYITNSKLNQINDDNFIIHDDLNNGWNVSSKLEQKEKEIIGKEIYIKSFNNTQKYWLKNPNFDTFHKMQTAIKNRNKCSSALMRGKNKEIINLNKDKNKLFEDYKNNNNIYENTSRPHYLRHNGSCEFLFKNKNNIRANLLNYGREENQWRDIELIEKMKLIEDYCDSDIHYHLNDPFQQDELKQEMLKNLIHNKERIIKEQLKIKEENKYENLIRKIKNKRKNKKNSPLKYSKYPITSKQKILLDNKSKITNMTQFINNEENKTYIQAFKKILNEQKKMKTNRQCLTNKNKKSKQKKIIYVHPGVYRQFNYIIHSYDEDEYENEELENQIGNKNIKEEKYMAWSCCNNIDKDSRGCEKKIINVSFI